MTGHSTAPGGTPCIDEINSMASPTPATDSIVQHKGQNKTTCNGITNDAQNRQEKPGNENTNRTFDEQLPCLMFDAVESSQKCSQNQTRGNESLEHADARLEKMCGAVRSLLECIGENPYREGLLATPARFSQVLLFLTQGYQKNMDDVINNAKFHERHEGMVTVRNIQVYSLCEHHLLPFNGKMHISYMPSDAILGLSKLPRIVEMYARRLQVQERLTQDVASAVMDAISPKGVTVVMEARHLCVEMRGIEQTGTTTITSCTLGCFKGEDMTHDQLLRLDGAQAP